MFKAIKRLREWNQQKKKFKKYLIAESKAKPNGQNDNNHGEQSSFKRRLTIKEIMTLKKTQRQEKEHDEMIQKVRQHTYQSQLSINQTMNQTACPPSGFKSSPNLRKNDQDNNSEDFESYKFSSSDSEEEPNPQNYRLPKALPGLDCSPAPKKVGFSKNLDSADQSQITSSNINGSSNLNLTALNSTRSAVPRKTLFEIRAEEKQRLEEKIYKEGFEEKMSKKTISKGTLEHIHAMMAKLNQPDYFLQETKINKREPQFSKRIE